MPGSPIPPVALAISLLHEFLGLPARFAERGHQHVLEHLDVFRVDRVRLDLHRQQLLLAVHAHGDHAAAGRALHLAAGQILLDARHLGLHFLGLLHQLAQVSHALHVVDLLIV